MKILLDECIDPSLVQLLPTHDVIHLKTLGHLGIKNGELVRLAAESFDCLFTVDRNMQHQTSLRDLDITVFIFTTKDRNINWQAVAKVFEGMAPQLVPGSYITVCV